MSPLNRNIAGSVLALGLACILVMPFYHAKPAGRSSASRRTTAESSAKLANSVKDTTKTRLVESYGKLPLSFEVNQGQANDDVKFLTRGSGYMILLTKKEAVLS